MLADGVGFEPTGLSPHRFSGPRRYNHFGNHPQWRREEDLNLHAGEATDGLANRSLTIRVTSPFLVYHVGLEPTAFYVQGRCSPN